MNQQKAIFLDRDGVINKEINYLYKIEDFEFIPDTVKALKILQNLGYLLFIVTNQAGIARGYYTEHDFNKLNSWMLAKFEAAGIVISDVQYCPHHFESGKGKYAIDCECRKPKPGMLNTLIKKYNVDVSKSILIGDKVSDVEAAVSANITTPVLVKSGHALPVNIPEYVSCVCENLYTFARLMETNAS
ncbi:D-glycero-beta-D-manno-heptose 1,7-bisphosphate 7-phosphatase [Paraglaciecola sp.]|uniref:D-glycero-beta-D-manno-heptose 1,7-bisphosphate 7-phosphatase n=1 Tax=Pseudomonadati TaxID=3379134 RepID=UPI00273D44CE|nr:D-glycero-beta-D-manno-heptose 1,7-bisphosphate 7-phosphatase [Paraglaciecola sp.]MDP5032546.1 D-glycero-beta-D-manno-heptose 1,7-bisphosphate 7-phosphatase [Paraglaciecola sp.]